jgi:hypothetical protein
VAPTSRGFALGSVSGGFTAAAPDHLQDADCGTGGQGTVGWSRRGQGLSGVDSDLHLKGLLPCRRRCRHSRGGGEGRRHRWGFRRSPRKCYVMGWAARNPQVRLCPCLPSTSHGMCMNAHIAVESATSMISIQTPSTTDPCRLGPDHQRPGRAGEGGRAGVGPLRPPRWRSPIRPPGRRRPPTPSRTPRPRVVAIVEALAASWEVGSQPRDKDP